MNVCSLGTDSIRRKDSIISPPHSSKCCACVFVCEGAKNEASLALGLPHEIQQFPVGAKCRYIARFAINKRPRRSRSVLAMMMCRGCMRIVVVVIFVVVVVFLLLLLMLLFVSHTRDGIPVLSDIAKQPCHERYMFSHSECQR